MKGAYLDHASATPVRKEVLEAMLPYYSEHFANPSTVYDRVQRSDRQWKNKEQRLPT